MAAWAYYNEVDPFAAEWLDQLIGQRLIAPGEVDRRSIEDVTADDLRGFHQHHFFAGIGVWSAALRLAGWPDERPIWTGSCPCQPFSAAGKGGGFADERHLWPAWHWLASQHRPDLIVGEQVASPAGLAWFDLVSSDLEDAGYAVGAADLCAAGVGAPHIRQRLWWVAHHHETGRSWQSNAGVWRANVHDADGCGANGALQHPTERGSQGMFGSESESESERRVSEKTSPRHSWSDTDWVACRDGKWRPQLHDADGRGPPSWPLADADGGNACSEGLQRGGQHGQQQAHGWADPDWIDCRDGKRRPVEPGTFPLAHGAPARVGRLRGYGNAIVLPLAATFLAAVQDCL